MKTTVECAPGKIILFGEHAVVHGQPAIAVPLTAVQVKVTASPLPTGCGLQVFIPDREQRIDPTTDAADPLYTAAIFPVQIALERLSAPLPNLLLTIELTIPVASGLGSGAALAAALIRATCSALEQPLPLEEINRLVYEVEKRHHGNPSGIDNTVIVYGKPVYFVRGSAPETFSIARPFTLLVADTGTGSPTKITVGDVGRLYAAEPERIGPIFNRIGKIAREARAAIESGSIDQLGPLMDENHALLAELTVSSPDLDRLCSAARAAGALGAKLSGGGRGGNLIALVEPERAPAVADALTRTGATRIIQTVVAPAENL